MPSAQCPLTVLSVNVVRSWANYGQHLLFEVQYDWLYAVLGFAYYLPVQFNPGK